MQVYLAMPNASAGADDTLFSFSQSGASNALKSVHLSPQTEHAPAAYTSPLLSAMINRSSLDKDSLRVCASGASRMLQERFLGQSPGRCVPTHGIYGMRGM